MVWTPPALGGVSWLPLLLRAGHSDIEVLNACLFSSSYVEAVYISARHRVPHFVSFFVSCLIACGGGLIVGTLHVGTRSDIRVYRRADQGLCRHRQSERSSSRYGIESLMVWTIMGQPRSQGLSNDIRSNHGALAIVKML